ncbi:N-acetylneuraminate lyase-like [Nasonia vitripennis]|uniref:N-acetylneuraminate lyase n=1 Tax=Nasonia vitripennis TaxID=7425 RepID=A0A7M7LRI8_NASVI|nr:N-acetylneuraminate lyase-like [Nasonia vitripennis]XP_031784920.1 N-acetylneuraminate lyase-like [Nasonia vitripennis]
MIRLKVVVLVIACAHFAASDGNTQQGVKFSYRGPLASAFTPFNNDTARTLNLSVIPKYAEFLASKNVSGVLVAGTYGQGTALSIEERKKLAEAWLSVVGKTKQHLMIHVGGASLRDVKELAAHAESIGVDSLLVRPELNATSTEEITNYLELV